MISKKTFWIVIVISLLVHAWQFHRQCELQALAIQDLEDVNTILERTRKAGLEICDLRNLGAAYCESKFPAPEAK